MSTIAAPDPAGFYTTQRVARVTGIPVTTILAWERRYGIPRPKRGEGGRRLYSEQDIELLRAMRARTAEGVRAEIAARELLAPPPAQPVARRLLPTFVPTEVDELRCLHCGQSCGELLSQCLPTGRVTRLVPPAHGPRPALGPRGRLRCGRCGGDLYREPLERRSLPQFGPAAMAPHTPSRGAA
ncbi:MAG TPA: MerR family transcriptional regulator [Chloroflexota bacterium]|jgi:DNA-binding transcriptional MerR regulator|nr:MerR family transcriptional regulator [Chloroflexota bacterium]